MSSAFTLGGSPSSIRSSAGLWSKFATAASTASGDITGVQSGEFVGDEGDTYRGRINNDLVPHLDVAADAWDIVSSALTVYADGLEELQSRMATLRTEYSEQQTTVSNAHTSWINAKAADQRHSDNREEAASNLDAGETLPADTYQAQAGSAYTSYTEAKTELQNLETKAAGIKSEHTTLMQTCCGEIGKAKDKRPVDPPGWRDKLKKAAGKVWNAAKKGVAWAAEHLGPILKVISAVAGILALIPVLTPIMGPIALATGAAALTLDVLNKLMNGKGSWLQIGIDTVGLIPGVKGLTSAAKVAKVAKAGKSLDSANKGVKAARSTFMAASRNTRVAKSALAAQKGVGRNALVRGFKSLVNRKGIKAANSTLAKSRSELGAARTALNSAKSKAANASTNFAKAGKNHDLAWKVVDPLASATGTTLIGVKTYQDTGGDWKATARAVGVSALGQKIPGASNKFNAVQNVVANGGATTNQAVNMAQNPEKFSDPKEWLKLTSSAAKTGTSVHTVSANSSAGTNPGATGAVGSNERSAFDRPAYTASANSTNINNGTSNAYNMVNSIEANAK